MIARLSRIASELKLLGFTASRRRVLFELKRRSGWTSLARRPSPIRVDRYLKRNGLAADADTYAARWRRERKPIGLPGHALAAGRVQALLGDAERARLLTQANDRHAGRFLLFHHQVVDCERQTLWHCDPETGRLWPRIHASRLLLRLHEFGDIKLVWELGRFGWVFDLVRAWLVDGQARHIDLLFDLFEDFAKNNPVHEGPQWASEQEVAIRALMLTFVHEVLADSDLLTPARLQALHALLSAHGDYLYQDLDYAQIAIRNNHLINGAVGLYAVAACVPWHHAAQRWHRLALAILQEAIDEQWYDDGGYVQPSHNYHRSAWHGMLWAHRIATCLGDQSLVRAIQSRAAASCAFLLAQLNMVDGRMPNFGPNDGALIGAWTSCDYTDYRPLLQSLAYVSGQPLPFAPGPWDEEGFWLFGQAFFDAPRRAPCPPGQAHFATQGIALVRPDADRAALLRCGTVRSRYGQQADQLHVDLWWRGRNVAVDAGSFNYNKALSTHNWFRGTASHNTVTIAGQDQMIPHRKFKFLQWSRARAGFVAASGADVALVGVHTGYLRLPGRWVHARLLSLVEDYWLVVDRVWPTRPLDAPVALRLHWQLGRGSARKTAEGVTLMQDQQACHFDFASTCDGAVLSTSVGQDDQRGLDGWLSRYYNAREPVCAVSLMGHATQEVMFATAISRSSSELRIDASAQTVRLAQHSVSVAPLFEQAPQWLLELSQ